MCLVCLANIAYVQSKGNIGRNQSLAPVESCDTMQNWDGLKIMGEIS